MLKKHFLLIYVVCSLFVASAFAGESKTQPITEESIYKVLIEELAWSHEDRKTESLEQREERARLMSKGLWTALKQLQATKELKLRARLLLGATVSIWWFETRFGRAVHAGELSRYGSDDGKAKCFGQLHERTAVTKREPGETMEEFRARQTAEWNALTGITLEATTKCAIATMRRFQGAVGTCTDWATAFGAYGTTKCEPLPTSIPRAELMSRLARQF